MLLYNDLSKAQRKWVDLVQIYFPEIKDTITYKEIISIHDFFVSKRSENKSFKCSKALWLISNNAISKGVYKFPSPELTETDLPEEVLSPEEIVYRESLKKFGIKPKN